MRCCNRSKLFIILTLCANAVFWWNYSTVQWDMAANVDGLPVEHDVRSPHEDGETPKHLAHWKNKRVKAKATRLQVDASLPNETVIMDDKTDHKVMEIAPDHVKNDVNSIHELNFMENLAKIVEFRDAGLEEIKKYNSHGVEILPEFDAETVRRKGGVVKTDPQLHHDKWIIVTSILPPTPDVKFLANITGWKVLVVGDTKTPGNWSYPNCYFLSVKEQKSLGFSITSRLPYRSYARKNIGYLFAIAHGAKVIYETDDDNRPLDRLESFRLQPTTSGLMFAGEGLFNPYRHFGQSTLWPRGYPLGAVGAKSNVSYRLHDRWATPAIQQGVVNGDPDMDAIFRLTRKQTLSRLEVTFDPAAPSVTLPEGVFSPFNSQNTLFLHDALWAMLLPTTTTFRMCDIWRGFWAQRLLWEISGRLAFFPSNAYQQRNAHSYMADAEDEKDMYFHTERLLDFLTEWSCPKNLSFFQCIYKLSSDMADQKFWKVGDVHVTRLWLEDLLKVGYPEPIRVKTPIGQYVISRKDIAAVKYPQRESKNLSDEDFEEFRPSELNVKWALTVKNGTFVNYVAAEQKPPAVYEDLANVVSRAGKHAKQIGSLCPGVSTLTVQTAALTTEEDRFFHDVLLVVVFNWPYYSNIRYLEVMYRHIFPNIAYCGDNSTKFFEETATLNSEATFIEAPVYGGVHGYVCTLKAMQIGYNVNGYLIVSDDAIMNTWNFYTFDKTRIWANYMVNMFDTKMGTDWIWWGTSWGAQAHNASITSLKHLSDTPKDVKNAQEFLATLANNTGDPLTATHATADVYYIPARLKDSALFYMSHFHKHELFLELVVNMMLYGLEAKADIQFFAPVNIWAEARLNPWASWSPDIHILHPVKFSNTSNLEAFCSQYLTNLLIRSHGHQQERLAQTHEHFQRLQDLYRRAQDNQQQILRRQKDQMAHQPPQGQQLQQVQQQEQQLPLPLQPPPPPHAQL